MCSSAFLSLIGPMEGVKEGFPRRKSFFINSECFLSASLGKLGTGFAR
jgi:hypothetical protein